MQKLKNGSFFIVRKASGDEGLMKLLSMQAVQTEAKLKLHTERQNELHCMLPQNKQACILQARYANAKKSA